MHDRLPYRLLRSLVSIVRKENRGFRPTRKILRRLEHQILALVTAIGVPLGDEYSAAFSEAVAALPTPRQEAEEFRKIARATDPLEPNTCSSRALVALNAIARDRWVTQPGYEPENIRYPLIKVRWSDLAVWQQASIREIAYELAKRSRSQIEHGTPTKTGFNALLIDLADIFLSLTNRHIDRLELPHAPRSRFIQFAHLVAREFFPTTEASPKALSNRWLRWKHDCTSSPRPVGPPRPSIRRRPKRAIVR